VNAGTSSFLPNQLSSPSQYLSNTFNSSISYSKTFGTKANLVTSLTHSQNNRYTRSFIKRTQHFFQYLKDHSFQNESGAAKWYNNLGFSYSAVAENRIDTKDSLLFKKSTLSNFNSGIKHVIPVSTSIKVLKYATLTPNVTYTERWYPKYVIYSWIAPDKS